jgi:hypothetical protein
MIKLLRLLKSPERLQSSLGLGMKVNSGFERLGALALTILYLDHLLACFWIMIGRYNFHKAHDGWLTPSIDSLSPQQVYLKAFYFIVTTMTTVGYGDMSGSTTLEQYFCILLMLGGVFIFSMISGSLAAVLSQLDNQNAEISEKVSFLTKM